METCRYFGTDGIRDRAGHGGLAPENLCAWGEAIAAELLRGGEGKPRILIGRDTRASGGEITGMLVRGIQAAGAEGIDLGVCATPVVSHLVRRLQARGGVVVSASHNPAEYNGIKVFSATGKKLLPSRELEIERRWESLSHEPPEACEPVSSPRSEHWELYAQDVRDAFGGLDLSGVTIGVDCANGAFSETGPGILESFGARVMPIACRPDGENINRKCGAVFPETVARAVQEQGADVGIAWDGDGDRAILTDEKGGVCDGDRMLAWCGEDLLRRGALPGGAVVGTQMSNYGLECWFSERGIRLIRTDVGDRWVCEEMERMGYALGGEPSGHIFFSHWGPVGDGLVTALKVLESMKQRGEPLSRMREQGFRPFPQILLNVPVGTKPPLEQVEGYREALEKAGGGLLGEGRMLVRYSGTEPLVRVMVEGPARETCERVAADMADFLKNRL